MRDLFQIKVILGRRDRDGSVVALPRDVSRRRTMNIRIFLPLTTYPVACADVFAVKAVGKVAIGLR